MDSLESRRSLYFLNVNYSEWFEPEFLSKIKGVHVDFVRIVSLLTNYHHLKRINPDAKISWSSIIPSSYSNKQYEEYYEKYIYSVTKVDSDYDRASLENTFGSFEEIFPDSIYSNRLSQVDQVIETLGLYEQNYEGVIKSDLYLFGLIYFVLLENKPIDVNNAEKIERLKHSLQAAEETFKNDTLHKKSPNTKTYLSRRIDRSINAYSKSLVEE